uniref:CDC42 small effector protein 1 n=1 Tax=Sus scrofa TaxID=9823 RepID=A0A8D0MEY8_PIG
MEERSVLLFPNLISGYELFLRIRKILHPSRFASPPSRRVNTPSSIPSGIGHRKTGGCACFCKSLKKVGAGGFGGSASSCPATSGARRDRAIPEGPAWMPGPPRGSTFPGSTRRGGGPRGLPRPLPRPFTEQCLLSPEWSCAPGSQPDGFRNRVAAVSALGQPHLCRPALGSPPRRGASPGTPHWRAPSGGPPPAAGRLDAVAEQKKKRRRIDRTMIGEPMNFVHLTHIGSGEMGAGDGLAMTGAVQEQMRSKGNRDRPWSNSRGL